ncbi:TRAP transporter small permease [Halomonas sp. McH1-25]|uniref:TRAP transporter small permease n=1 Tax=unclassified Halomonas TaxID=2609666 RepID=UPI001EF6136C|nr:MULTISPECIES: TRAP transporter small permease [unclassified Halomonas]MCG7599880.1 TRAP transporter small permease [Halomonas sp. McH1-25]MCP1344382.1 TRAP transporter small permease [Halomonas sp. FL8]MCP1362874.1 TRAP transporter small permease [Halomonas sp. BBD45]
MTSLRSRVLAVSRPLSLCVASTLLFIDLAVILYGVFMRYLAGGAPIWTDELARYLIIGSVLLAAGAVWVEGGHMRVALIEKLLPAGLCRLLNWYQWLLTLGLAVAGTIISYDYAQSVSMFTSSGLGISRTIPMMSLPVGFALLAWHVLWYGPAPLRTQVEETI